jgi:hypothetical protein
MPYVRYDGSRISGRQAFLYNIQPDNSISAVGWWRIGKGNRWKSYLARHDSAVLIFFKNADIPSDISTKFDINCRLNIALAVISMSRATNKGNHR